MFQDFRIFILALLPGIITIFATLCSIFAIWEIFFSENSLWYLLGMSILIGPIFWILFANISLLFVEDTIMDKVQEVVWGKIRISSTKFSMRRLWLQVISTVCVLLIFLYFTTGLFIFGPIITAWLTAWSFLFSFYNRQGLSLKDSLSCFFKNILSNTFLGFTLMILLFVPFVNIFLVGYAIILSTLLAMKNVEKIEVDS